MSPVEANLQDGQRWMFDGEVAESFDDMLARSIPQYDVMRRTVYELGSRFVQPGTAVVDLGTSRGEALEPFVRRFGARNRFVGVDVSQPMLEAARSRFEGYTETGVVSIEELDLRRDYPPCAASLTLAILTLQFVPIEHRARVLADAFEHTTHGGAVVVVEKVLGESAPIDAHLVGLYHDHKRQAGYTDDEIIRKALSLEGVLVPVTARWNVELLSWAGFAEVECFWRWANFAGWVAVKR